MAIDSGNTRHLIIPDLQIPFEHAKAFDFCRYIKRHYGIPDENVYNVGDELDQYHGGMWPKSPDAKHTANSEIQESIEKLKEWYAHFPLMKLATSNHGSRWIRKATKAEIPSIMMKDYQQVIQAPEGWKWARIWRVHTKNPFIVQHGHGYGGQFPHVNAALANGLSTAIGHHHSICGIEHRKTDGFNIWAMATGSLIDFDAFAFEYAWDAKFKPQVGVGVVIDEGKYPLWIPLE